jgi:hypothetical protein
MSHSYVAFNSYFGSHNVDVSYPVIKETVPVSSLGYSTNTRYPDFPPLMNDGRSITASWQPESIINEDLIESNDITSNWEYRKYLTENAKKVMEFNFRESSNDIGYYRRAIDLPSIQKNTISGDITNTPYQYASISDNTRPSGYTPSDLKDIYMSREQLDSRKVSPAITQYQLLTK